MRHVQRKVEVAQPMSHTQRNGECTLDVDHAACPWRQWKSQPACTRPSLRHALVTVNCLWLQAANSTIGTAYSMPNCFADLHPADETASTVHTGYQQPHRLTPLVLSDLWASHSLPSATRIEHGMGGGAPCHFNCHATAHSACLLLLVISA